MNRRQFARTSALSLAALSLPRWLSAAGPAGLRYRDTLGLQLWTVRNQMAKDMLGTLRAVKAAGYAQVELMRTMDAREILTHTRELGLKVTSAMIDWNCLVNPTAPNTATPEAHLQVAREIGLRYLVFGYIGKGHRETVAQMKALAARANDFGRKCRDAGVQLCYHHHSFEFAKLDDGATTGWQIFTGEFDPALVQFEIDVFWAAIGGLDPVKTLRDLRGRVAQVHLKDLEAGHGTMFDEGKIPVSAFKELGRGTLDMKAIVAACAAAGVAQCHVEQDQSPDPIRSIGTSIGFMSQPA
ncbi:MAG: TIM barrel protein [Verrucomicrobia bacterium]|nr:TIM barrel protein [Verrucomicrobiota bacterium]